MRGMNHQHKVHKVVQLLSQTIHAFQEERGTLCLYLSDFTEMNLKAFKSKVKNTDGLIDQLHELIQLSAAANNQYLTKNIDKVQQSLKHFISRATFRKEVKDLSITAGEALMFYSHQIINHLVCLMIEIILAIKPDKSLAISALSNFVKWKERIGRERALGSMGINMEQFNSDVFLHDFEMILDEQQINKRTFLALASEHQKVLFNQLFIEQLEIEAVHKQIEKAQAPKIKAQFWFDLLSQKMHMMHHLENHLITALFSNRVKVSHPNDVPMFNEKEQLEVEDCLLFRGLSTQVKQKLLQSSNIKKYKKGSLLFLEGEQASRIYVVISGWVKIFKSSSDGAEKIEHMLTSGDVVIESSIFESSNYNNSAQVSVEGRLLSFPAAIYRHWVSQDLTLALNSLKYLSQTANQYQLQVEANRVKSTKERVGHFLLKQFVVQKNPNTIMLPYEKTIIASLLDMKPETFSRSLKSFKNEGLSSEKQQIQVRNMKMLCEYCDKEIAQSCQFKQQHDCQFNESTNQLRTNPQHTFKSCS